MLPKKLPTPSSAPSRGTNSVTSSETTMEAKESVPSGGGKDQGLGVGNYEKFDFVLRGRPKKEGADEFCQVFSILYNCRLIIVKISGAY